MLQFSLVVSSPPIFSPPWVGLHCSTHIANGLVTGLQRPAWKGGFVCTHAPSAALRQYRRQETPSADLAATRHLLPDSLSLPYKSRKKGQRAPSCQQDVMVPLWIGTTLALLCYSSTKLLISHFVEMYLYNTHRVFSGANGPGVL